MVEYYLVRGVGVANTRESRRFGNKEDAIAFARRCCWCNTIIEYHKGENERFAGRPSRRIPF